MPRPLPSLTSLTPLTPALLIFLAAAACGSNKDQDGGAPSATPVTSAAPSAAIPDAPPSPLSVVLESKTALTFSGLEGGVWISDESKTHVAKAIGAGDLTAAPMPEGLPAGPGRILGVAGKLPHSIWLSYEKQKDDGKPESTPLFRLTKDQWKVIADDWKPQICAWSKNRLLSASTSSSRLKIKVIEPSGAKAPPDLPSTHLNDEACEKTLKIERLAALRSGEVFAAGSCKQGAASSVARAVVIRWIPESTAGDGGAPPASSASAKAVASAAPIASASTAPPVEDAGAEEPKAPDTPPGVVDVLPGTAARAVIRGLVARSGTLAFAAGVEGEGKGTPASRLWRFDGAAWAADGLPPTSQLVRSIAATEDGTLWLVTDHEIWKRGPAGTWEAVPPPTRAFPEPEPSWDFSEVWVSGEGDVWIAARHASKVAKRDVILRLKAPKEIIRF